ncbi:MAG TPA: AMP-binding protein [Aestuariivirgaceae bacterium]|nr:AMP-binding protein [Aestuariivirgaceae bacterium]
MAEPTVTAGHELHLSVAPAWSAVAFDTVVEMAVAGCQTAPDQPAIILDDGIVVSRGTLLDQARRLATRVEAIIAPGDRVAMMIENRAECMIAFIGVIMGGGVLVSMNPALRSHDAAHILRDCGCVLLLTGPELMATVESTRAACPALREVILLDGPEPFGWDATAGLDPGSAPRRTPARRKDIATVYYTSGTTGAPKGCMLDHEWWLRLCDIHLRLTGAGEDHRPLCCLPFYNADAMQLLLCALHRGGTLVAMRRFSASRFWQVVAEHRVSELFLLASMPILLLKQPPHPEERQHRLRTAVCALVPADLHRELNDRFGVAFLDSYGSTEAGWVTRVPSHMAAALVGSGTMGAALPEIELRVVDPNGRDVPDGVEGELLIRGPGLFSGYLDNEPATAEAMRGGWFHSGDVVRQDGAGLYYFVGRSKDIIRRSGVNISASEVEAVLRTHPLVIDAAVVAFPDPIRQEEVKAHLWIRPEAVAADMAGDILAFCRNRLAAHKAPRFLAFHSSDFPRTPTLRVRKQDLAGVAPELGTWDSQTGSWAKPPEGI